MLKNLLKNLLKTSFRNLVHGKLFSAINVLALTIGVASVMLVGLYIRHQLSYDDHWTCADRIYRVQYYNENNEGDWGYTSYITQEFAEQIVPSVPAIEAVSRYAPWDAMVFLGDRTVDQDFAYVDPALLSMIDLEMIEGTPGGELPDPNSALLSESTAMKLFGRTTDLVGKNLQMTLFSEREEITVRGVYRDLPETSVFDLPMLLDYKHARDDHLGDRDNAWGSVFSETFVMLYEGSTWEEAEEQLGRVDLGVEESELRWSMYPAQYDLQPLLQAYTALFNPRGFVTITPVLGIWVLGTIGVIILLLAIVNFTMLTVGRSATRMREVGVRKVLGANRGQIALVFWIETALLAFLAVLAGLITVELISPLFQSVSGIRVSPELNLDTLILSSGVWLVTTLLAGFAPVLSMLRVPITPALRGAFKIRGRSGLRRSMLSIQLIVSVAMIAAAVVMTGQFSYIQERDLGFDVDQIVMLDATAERDLAHKGVERLRSRLAGDPGVVAMSESACSFGRGWNVIGWNVEGFQDEGFWFNIVDSQYLKVIDVAPLAGRGFQETDAGRSDVLVINEEMAKRLGFLNPQQAIGQSNPDLFPNATIVGVIPDFHFNDLYNEVEPMILVQDFQTVEDADWGWVQQHSLTRTSYILIRLQGEGIMATMNRIEAAWRRVIPESDFSSTFVSQQIENQYRDDRRWNRTVLFAAVLAVLISLMGLVGVSVLQVAERTKEIGIRKVLGASISRILLMLSREILYISLIANLVAWPLAWWAMHSWLQNFAYHITLNPMLFIGSGILLLMLALGTVLTLSYSAATLNPANTLRNE